MSHYDVLEKVRLTFMKKGQNTNECWRTLEVGGGALDDRCRSLVVVGERRVSRSVFDMSKICNVLQRSWWNARWAFCERDGGRSLEVGGGRDENADGRPMDSGNPASALPKRSHTVHVPFLLRSASAHWRSLTVFTLSPSRPSADLSVPVPTEYRSCTVLWGGI